MPVGEGLCEALSSPKKVMVRPILLSLLPPISPPFLSPLPPTTWAEAHVHTTGRRMRQTSIPPPLFFLSHSHILFPFFFIWVPENTSKQTQLANDSGLAIGWS